MTEKENRRRYVLLLRDDGWTLERIADRLGIAKGTVHRIIHTENTNHHPPCRPRGRPYKLSDRERKRLVSVSRRHPRWSLKDIIREQPPSQRIHPSTLSRILRRSGARCVRCTKKPFLSNRHRMARLRFARGHRSMDWTDVIFSDEKRFRLRSDGPQKAWRHPGAPFPVIQTEKFGGGSIMVWGAIRDDGCLWIQRCSDHMDHTEYQQVIERAMDDGLFLRKDRTTVHHFQHDGASPHRAAYTKAFFQINSITVLDWPAQSPDLNIMEHVWPMISRRLGVHRYNSKEALWVAIQHAANELSFSTDIQTLYHSMTSRLDEVRRARGGHTRY